MTATSTPKVWDLTDSSARRHQERRGLDLGGPIAVALAVVALTAASAPGVELVVRWCIVASFGGFGMLVAFSSLRRRQTVASLLVGLTGLVLPVAAVAMAVFVTSGVPATVSNTSLQSSAVVIAETAPSPTAEFEQQLPLAERDAAARSAVRLAFRLRMLHGTGGPYPGALASSGGTVVERGGIFRGIPLGVVAENTHLVYAVTADRDAFRLTVISNVHPDAAISVTSSLVLPGSEG